MDSSWGVSDTFMGCPPRRQVQQSLLSTRTDGASPGSHGEVSRSTGQTPDRLVARARLAGRPDDFLGEIWNPCPEQHRRVPRDRARRAGGGRDHGGRAGDERYRTGGRFQIDLAKYAGYDLGA